MLHALEMRAGDVKGYGCLNDLKKWQPDNYSIRLFHSLLVLKLSQDICHVCLNEPS